MGDREGGGADNLQKKSKKRKERESTSLIEEDGKVRAEGDHRKKKKSKLLIDNNASEVVADVESGSVARSSGKKEKKDKGKNKIETREEVSDNKRDKRKNDNGSGDERSAILDASGEKIHEESNSKEMELTEKKEKKQKKKKGGNGGWASHEMLDGKFDDRVLQMVGKRKKDEAGDGTQAPDVLDEKIHEEGDDTMLELSKKKNRRKKKSKRESSYVDVASHEQVHEEAVDNGLIMRGNEKNKGKGGEEERPSNVIEASYGKVDPGSDDKMMKMREKKKKNKKSKTEDEIGAACVVEASNKIHEGAEGEGLEMTGKDESQRKSRDEEKVSNVLHESDGKVDAGSDDQGLETRKRKKKKKSRNGVEEGASSIVEASNEKLHVEPSSSDKVDTGCGGKVLVLKEKQKKSETGDEGGVFIEKGMDYSADGELEMVEDKEKRSGTGGLGEASNRFEALDKKVCKGSVDKGLESREKKKKKKSKSGDEKGPSHFPEASNEEVQEELDAGRLKIRGKKQKSEASNKVETSFFFKALDETFHEESGDRELETKGKKYEQKKKKSKMGDGTANVTEASHEMESMQVEELNGGEHANIDASKTHESDVDPSEKSTPSSKSKKVRFSSEVEILSTDNVREKEKLKDDSKGKKKRVSKGKVKLEDDSQEEKKGGDGLVRGKRFSKEEDKTIMKAVYDYIDMHELGEGGLEMVLKCRSHPELKDCWREIGEALPLRPYQSVYYRAHLLFERSENRKWTDEELELVKKFHDKHGADWRTLADELGKHRWHVKDAYRRIKFAKRKTGHWSQDEYQKLFDLVNVDLSMKVHQDKKSKHGMLRDNISWEAISERLETRTFALCCHKWYDQLTSPMVAAKIWADSDDYRMLMALDELDATCQEDVDWDSLLEHRSGEVCRKRWNEMVRHLGEHGLKSFSEQVEVLSKRYCPDLLEARETYENKPTVD